MLLFAMYCPMRSGITAHGHTQHPAGSILPRLEFWPSTHSVLLQLELGLRHAACVDDEDLAAVAREDVALAHGREHILAQLNDLGLVEGVALLRLVQLPVLAVEDAHHQGAAA